MTSLDIEFKGFQELERAIKRNPQKVIEETQIFLQRGMAVYRSGIQNNPWRVGQGGGGSPVKTRNLLQSHDTIFDRFEASIGPGRRYPVKYSLFVHEGTRKMTGRPWLDYVKKASDNKIKPIYRGLLQNIVSDLAK